MSRKWFATALLALAAGCCFAGSALAQDELGMLDENLVSRDNGHNVTLTHTGKDGVYLIAVERLPGSEELLVSFHKGLVEIPVESAKTVMVYKLQPIAKRELMDIFRPCNPPDIHDCPLPRFPLPPPPPPPMHMTNQYFFLGPWIWP